MNGWFAGCIDSPTSLTIRAYVRAWMRGSDDTTHVRAAVSAVGRGDRNRAVWLAAWRPAHPTPPTCCTGRVARYAVLLSMSVVYFAIAGVVLKKVKGN